MDVGMHIRGAEVPAASGATFVRKNPVTGEVVTRAAAAAKADVDRAVEAAADAFPTWSKTPPNERRVVLLEAADLFAKAVPDLIEVAFQEVAGTRNWHEFTATLAPGMIREAASLTTQIKGEVIPSDYAGTRLALAIRRPVGVLVGMAPWNASIPLAVRAFVTPLACGNTVVLKASERCPATHVMIGEIFSRAGLPAGALNIVTHAAADAPEVVEALIAHPKVKRINFTGSTRVGRVIAEQAGRHLKPVLLELGGKAPLIVLDDAHIEGAVGAAIFGAFLNQGQICMSTERIIVDQTVADAFVQRFTERTQALSFGPAANAIVGSVVDDDIMVNVRRLVEDAVAKGAVVAAGGVPLEGTYMPATVVLGVTPDMALFNEESFGPIVAITSARDTDHAVELANRSDYGLSAAVFGADVYRALAVAERIESGVCHINGPTVSDESQMPFGGTKASGYGRFGGQAGIDQFTELRWLTLEDPHQTFPF